MGAPPTLERLNHRHDAIILWLLSNPDKLLGDCAEYFGYTQAWLSRIIHTDMFQAAYREKALELKEAPIYAMQNKVAHLAAVSVERATERIEQGVASERFLGDTMKNALAAMGYGGGPMAPVVSSQTVHVHIDAERLVEARERAAQARLGTTQAKLTTGSSGDVLEAEFTDMKPKGPVQ